MGVGERIDVYDLAYKLILCGLAYKIKLYDLAYDVDNMKARDLDI